MSTFGLNAQRWLPPRLRRPALRARLGLRSLSRLWPPRISKLRRWAPKSLFGRSLLIIVLPIAMMQVAVTWAFFEAH